MLKVSLSFSLVQIEVLNHQISTFFLFFWTLFLQSNWNFDLLYILGDDLEMEAKKTDSATIVGRMVTSIAASHGSRSANLKRWELKGALTFLFFRFLEVSFGHIRTNARSLMRSFFITQQPLGFVFQE